jgi:hypothetical protein
MSSDFSYLGSGMPFFLGITNGLLVLSSGNTTIATGTRAELTTFVMGYTTLRTGFFFVCHNTDS